MTVRRVRLTNAKNAAHVRPPSDATKLQRPSVGLGVWGERATPWRPSRALFASIPEPSRSRTRSRDDQPSAFEAAARAQRPAGLAGVHAPRQAGLGTANSEKRGLGLEARIDVTPHPDGEAALPLALRRQPVILALTYPPLRLAHHVAARLISSQTALLKGNLGVLGDAVHNDPLDGQLHAGCPRVQWAHGAGPRCTRDELNRPLIGREPTSLPRGTDRDRPDDARASGNWRGFAGPVCHRDAREQQYSRQNSPHATTIRHSELAATGLA